MALADSNVWLALALSKHAFHASAKDWFAAQRPGAAAFCRSTQQSLLRLLTTKAVFAPYHTPPMNNRTAWSFFESLRADERVAWLQEPAGLDAAWRRLAGASHAAPKLWMDAYLAAFAVTSDQQFVTTDRAFTQFKGLKLLVLSR